jgi:hypothetical protein
MYKTILLYSLSFFRWEDLAMKRLMAGLLTGVMLISATQGAFAAEDWLTYGNGTTSIKYSTYTGAIKRAINIANTEDHASPVNVKTVSISIPTEINGTKIVSVAKSGFFDFDELASIELPDTLTEIGEMAFMGADNLTSITVPDKVAEITKASFKSCDSLASVKLGKGVTSIAAQAFYGCKSLKSLTVNNGCKTIDTSAFELCSSMTGVILPSTLTTIGGSAFKDCRSLTEVTIPSGVTKIDANTFSGCKALKTVQINGNVTSIGKNAFKDCSELTNIYIPESCKSIEDNTFSGCKKLTIHCEKGSYADGYARSNKITVVNDKTLNEFATAEVPSSITVVLDGKVLDFKGVEPQIIGGSTMVPMRVIFEALDCVMDWDASTKTVSASRGVKSMSLTVNHKTAVLNGKNVTLDAAPCIVNGSTLVPVRFVSEALGLEVKWDQNTRTVNLISK